MLHRHSERSEDNSEGECCKNELAHFYNRAKELGALAQSSQVLYYRPPTRI